MVTRKTVFAVRDYDLAATLTSGQAFRWQMENGAWTGVIGGRWLRLRAAGNSIFAETAEPQAGWRWLADYLQVEIDFDAVLKSFPDDAPMRAAVAACRGLRLLRQEPWECLASFILSSTKQIVQIRQIVALLCERFGEPLPVTAACAPAFSFPSAAQIAALSELDLRNYRRQIGMVPQTTLLFNGTLRENVTYGLEKISDDALWQILADANLTEFVRALPQGLDTPLGESGSQLSGGQRQRLAIARALVRNPRLVILDEATSALDTGSERLVQEALVRLARGRTTLIVAHRFSTIRHAHRIVVLHGGKIVEQGTHAELLAREGHFFRLASLQSVTTGAVETS